MAERRTGTSTTTRVEHVARPLGRDRENGPHLGDLRAFVAECDGLPDEVRVSIDKGHLDEGGRLNVTFRLAYQHPSGAGDEAAAGDGL